MRNCVTVGAFLVLTASANAQVFYGVTNNGGLRRFDIAAQTVTALNNIQAGPNQPTGFQDLEYDASGNLYAVRGYTDFSTFQSFNELYRITNPNTGASLLSGSMATGGNPFHSLANRPSNSTLYSVNAVNGHVVTMATNGAFASVSGVGNGPRNLVNALAVNPVDGQAYGLIDLGVAIIGTIDYTLIRTNLDTGISTIVGSLGNTTEIFTSLRFDLSGNAYTVGVTQGNVYNVNTATGAASFLFAGGNNARNVTGIALVVPTPAGLGVLALGGIAVARRRRR